MGHLFSSPAPAPTPSPTRAPSPFEVINEREGEEYQPIQVLEGVDGSCNGCEQDNNLGDDVSDNSLAQNVGLNRDTFIGGEGGNNYTTMISGSWIEIICICLIILLCLNILCLSYNLYLRKNKKNQKKVAHYVENGGYTSNDDKIPFKNNT